MEYISQKVAICSLWTVCPCLYTLLCLLKMSYKNIANLEEIRKIKR